MDEIPQRTVLFEQALNAIRLLSLYHRYEVLGLENVPKNGPVILVVNHSFATYDTMLLGAEIYDKTGRYGMGLADRRIFQTPFLAGLFTALGMQQGSPEVAEALLKKGHMLALSPGGMRESLRSSEHRYEINWAGRLGFIRLAIKTQTPVLLAACPQADDLYTLYENPLTTLVYEKFKWPLPILRGWGPTLLPRPIKLTHYICEPLVPPKMNEDLNSDELVQQFHSEVTQRMNDLLSEAISEKK